MSISPTLSRRITASVNALLFLVYLLVLVSFVVEHGCYVSWETLGRLRSFDLLVVGLLILYQAIKLGAQSDRREYIRSRRVDHWLSIGFLVAALLLLAAGGAIERSFGLRAGAAFGLLTALAQAVILAEMFLSVGRNAGRLAALRIQPARLFLGSFVLVILTGTAALLLPKATTGGIRFVDALFTSTSAVCVTGLVVVDTATAFTALGQTVILVLIQIGGLGLMTFTTFFAMFSGSLSISERVMMQEFLSQDSIGRIRSMLTRIFVLTFGIELLGAVSLYVNWGAASFAGEGEKVFSSVFNAVSAFCNAGFSLFSANLAERGVAMNTGVNLTITSLIILGGIGFVVMSNLLSLRTGKRRIRIRNQLTVHTKMVLIMTALLILAGTVVMYILDGGGSLRQLSTGDKLLASYFQSVSTRTAGFNTVDIGALSAGTALFFIVLMFIGASPGSTGGGIKTSTAAVVFLYLWNAARGRSKVEFGRRRIPSDTVEKAFIVTVLAACVLVASSFLLALVEPKPYLDLLFECSSALGTVGLSRNLTPSLSDFSKCVLSSVMLIGRVGAITIIAALIRRTISADYDYPSGNVLIG